jgi:hypothetical protein
MSRYEVELLDLAKEIAASEGIPLAAALERATVELRGLYVYAVDWNQSVADAQWKQIGVAQTA